MTRCYLKQFTTTPCEYRADRLPDRAHLIPKQRLAAAGIEELWDERAWIPACRKHHHLLDHGFIRLSLDQYPPEFIAFATEYGLYFNGTRDGWRVSHRGRKAA